MVLIVEYDGAQYNGFQLQTSVPTIQGEIEKSISRLTGEKRRILAASRTDTGVHARGQVVSFSTGSSLPPETFVKGLNYYLPEDIAIKAAYRVPDSFNVQRQAISREYRYCILNQAVRSPLQAKYVYQVSSKLDIENMNRACQALIGEHDLVSFVTSLADASISSTFRIVYEAKVRREEGLVVFYIKAKSFLPHQVRNTVGSLIRVGLGKLSAADFNDIMQARQAGLAGPTAPASGLCLMKVNYPVPFEEIG